MQAKVVGKAGYVGNFSGYDEYVPMVDKAVDAEWKKQVSLQQSLSIKGDQCHQFSFFVLTLFLDQGWKFWLVFLWALLDDFNLPFLLK